MSELRSACIRITLGAGYGCSIFTAKGMSSLVKPTSMIVLETASIGIHRQSKTWDPSIRFIVIIQFIQHTVSASKRAPRLRDTFTMTGNHSEVDQAPLGSPPQICPMRKDVASSPLFAKI